VCRLGACKDPMPGGGPLKGAYPGTPTGGTTTFCRSCAPSDTVAEALLPSNPLGYCPTLQGHRQLGYMESPIPSTVATASDLERMIVSTIYTNLLLCTHVDKRSERSNGTCVLPS
jgi:hypothetical protein